MKRFLPAILGVVGLGCALAGVGCSRSDITFWMSSYLVGFLFAFSISVGALFWVIVHHVTCAKWSVVVRRQWENLAAQFPVLALLFVPLLVFPPALWVVPDEAAPNVHIFQNSAFFGGRAVIYFLFMGGLAWLLRRSSLIQDHSPKNESSMRKWCFVMLPGFAFCVLFSAIDWTMGRDGSSMVWGVYVFSGQMLAGLLGVILLVIPLRRHGLPVTHDHLHLLGNLLLAFTAFWAYIAYSQYLVVWYADIPHETRFFIPRGSGFWQFSGVIFIFGAFLIPFLILLNRASKRSSWVLSGLAIWLLLMRFFDLLFIVLPPAGEPYFSFSRVLGIAVCPMIYAAAVLRSVFSCARYPLNGERLASSLRSIA